MGVVEIEDVNDQRKIEIKNFTGPVLANFGSLEPILELVSSLPLTTVLLLSTRSVYLQLQRPRVKVMQLR